MMMKKVKKLMKKIRLKSKFESFQSRIHKVKINFLFHNEANNGLQDLKQLLENSLKELPNKTEALMIWLAFKSTYNQL